MIRNRTILTPGHPAERSPSPHSVSPTAPAVTTQRVAQHARPNTKAGLGLVVGRVELGRSTRVGHDLVAPAFSSLLPPRGPPAECKTQVARFLLLGGTATAAGPREAAVRRPWLRA